MKPREVGKQSELLEMKNIYQIKSPPGSLPSRLGQEEDKIVDSEDVC